MGADAIGLVFYEPSPRAVTIAQAKQIVEGLPPFVTVVALFVDADVSFVNACLNEVRIDLLQFHGNESADYCEQFNMPYMKAIRMKEDTQLFIEEKNYASASALLLDSYKVGIPGGTGETFNWSMITKIDKPIILAGGLTVENVAMAIEQVNPYAIDVSGGVEKSKGIKDKQKIRTFMHEVANG
jgi:phosphoribosylanthranilate isomerase